MVTIRKKLLLGLLTISMLSSLAAPDAFADHRGRYYRDRYYNGYDNGGVLRGHPYVKKALIGGGVGAVIGGLASPDGARVNGAVKGGLIGGAVGLGYEYLKRKNF